MLGKDFAPYSFDFALYRPGVKDARKFVFNGGLIFSRPELPGRWLVPLAHRQPRKRHRLVLSYVSDAAVVAMLKSQFASDPAPNALFVRGEGAGLGPHCRGPR